MTDTEQRKGKSKSQWLSLVIATLLGIAATIGVGWYQLSKAEKQAYLAEQERAKNVQESLITIVEEHILNSKPIDIGRLTRLIDQRRREQKIKTIITISDIIEKAEFNILKSRYLSFDRKEEIKPIIDQLYAEQSKRKFHEFDSSVSNADLLNELAKNIQDQKTAKSLEFLKRLQEAHLKDLEKISPSKASRNINLILKEMFELILKNPVPLVFMLMAYAFFLSLVDRKSPFRKLILSIIERRIESEKEQAHEPDDENKKSANKTNSADAKGPRG